MQTGLLIIVSLPPQTTGMGDMTSAPGLGHLNLSDLHEQEVICQLLDSGDPL